MPLCSCGTKSETQCLSLTEELSNLNYLPTQLLGLKLGDTFKPEDYPDLKITHDEHYNSFDNCIYYYTDIIPNKCGIVAVVTQDKVVTLIRILADNEYVSKPLDAIVKKFPDYHKTILDGYYVLDSSKHAISTHQILDTTRITIFIRDSPAHRILETE